MTPTTTWEQSIRAGHGVVVTTIQRVDSGGVAWVHRPDQPPAAARITTAVTTVGLREAAENGAPVVVAFEGDDDRRPIILGILQTGESAVEACVDGRRVVLTGEEEVTLRCGEASITLTKAGKIILRGAYVSSRSSGVNAIKGASVRIN
ncbi:MAG: DUF6484 domain-containing protein [Candidatus Zixiibacteriota bacterium]